MVDAEKGEVARLQGHLNLLRAEYVKLQTRLAEVEKKYQIAQAAAGRIDNDNFVTRLLHTIAELFDKELYSDLTVKLLGQSVHAHKFVLAARSDHWGVASLNDVSELDLTDVRDEVGLALLRWVYTDEIETKQDDQFLLDLLRATSKFQLHSLKDRCEQGLMASVNVRNCIQFYQTAEEIGAYILRQHCSELISNHWNDFTSEDFASMPAALLYKMFKSKTQYPLHTAIRAHREDAVFLYLIEFDAELPVKLNEVDNRGDLPLDLALKDRLESIALSLVKHKADVSQQDSQGESLLHRAITRGDEFSASFLIREGASVNTTTNNKKETPLHLTAAFCPLVSPPEVLTGMARVARQLLEAGANANLQNSEGSTPLHRAILAQNEEVFSLLLEGQIDLELQNNQGQTVLAQALETADTEKEEETVGDVFTPESFAARLIAHGSSPNAINNQTDVNPYGDSLLHVCARSGRELAGLFLTAHGAQVNQANLKGETPLHTSCSCGLTRLTRALLDAGANPNSQTTQPLEGSGEVYCQTPLHLAINKKHQQVVKVMLQYKADVSSGGSTLQIIPNLNLKDSTGQTVLGLALWTGTHDTARELLRGGADINNVNIDGETLLHQAINKSDEQSAIFLLDNQADIQVKNSDNLSPLQLAINHKLSSVVQSLCIKGSDINSVNQHGDCALWSALETGQSDIASILVRHGCDMNVWEKGPSGCRQTLLHRAIDENNENIGCFLIKNGCDVNSTRRPGPNGEGAEEAEDGQTPIHMASTWGLEMVVQSLVEHNADINAQDTEGQTALHVAISNQHHVIIALLLAHPGINLATRDRRGNTPFAAAMTTKNNKAAQAILEREPTAAEQFDNRGRNFLHTAIQKADIESVLFLISVHANVNSRVQDSQRLTPLHLAVQVGEEMIVRNLLLAGASVNERTPLKQTALHLAALFDRADIARVLLENGIDYDAVDDSLNNAIHVSVQNANLNTARVLLTESHINAEAINMRGQNPLHMLGQYGKDNAAAIFELFHECMPDYPIDKPDANGNSALLLAYNNGNGNLTRAIVRAGACLGTVNKDGMSIFNAPVATKQLLFKLLDMLSKEPAWSDNDNCLECGTKFGIKTRKHHCRHCGRILCSKCSDRDVPIIKYNLTKPVRVCAICFDVLSLNT